MYSLIALNQIKPGKVEAVTKELKEFLPILKKNPGFHSIQVIAGVKGEYTALMLWDNRTNAENYAKSPGRKKFLADTREMLESDMKSQFGEVIFSATA
jgi:antibiotic biosynthesis monooxygenase (ABM) superfamily enzyme